MRSKSLFGSGLAGNYKEIIPRIFSKRMAAPLILFESADFIFLEGSGGSVARPTNRRRTENEAGSSRARGSGRVVAVVQRDGIER